MDPMNPQGGDDQNPQQDPMGMPSSSQDDSGMGPNPVGGGGSAAPQEPGQDQPQGGEQPQEGGMGGDDQSGNQGGM